MSNKYIIGPIIAVVVIGAGAFYGGMVYGQSQGGRGLRVQGQNGGMIQFQGGNTRVGMGQGGLGGQGQIRMFGGGTIGDVISKDDRSFTVKLQDGGSKIVFYSASTTVNKMNETSMSDVEAGSHVSVLGTANQDGSVTANQVQLLQALPTRPPQP